MTTEELLGEYDEIMKIYKLLVMGLVTAAIAAGIIRITQLETPKPSGGSSMKITSSAFDNNGAIESAYSCQGAGDSPPLSFSDVPTGTKSLALVVDDPDAPGGTFDHWVVWNISPDVDGIDENWVPGGGAVVGANGTGKNAWTPPCPPSGTHHYHFKLYAMTDKLSLAAGSSKAELDQAMAGHISAQSELVATYTKK